MTDNNEVSFVRYPGDKVEHEATGEDGVILAEKDGYIVIYFRGRSIYEAGRGSTYQPALTIFGRIIETAERFIKIIPLLEYAKR